MTTRCHTFTGTGFDPFAPRPEDVRIEDIAHHLALTCRYGGAVPVFYSVAEHAVRVARIVEDISGNPKWAMMALHHDSAEAYVHDIRRPIKRAVLIRCSFAQGLAGGGEYPVSFETLELRVLGAIHTALGIQGGLEAEDLIDDADEAMLKGELHGLFGDNVQYGSITNTKLEKSQTWGWSRAERVFLEAHRRLERIIQKAGKA